MSNTICENCGKGIPVFNVDKDYCQSCHHVKKRVTTDPGSDELLARVTEREAQNGKLKAVCEKLTWLYSEENEQSLRDGLRIDGLHEWEHLDTIISMAKEALKGDNT